MKFFKWLIGLKIKKLDSEERVAYLANKLIDEVQKAGHCIRSQGDFAHVDIYCHRVDSNDASIVIGNRTNDVKDWSIRKKLTTEIRRAK